MKDFLDQRIQDFPTLRIVLVVQLLFIVFVFHKIVFFPTQYIFSDGYEATRGYFSNHSFLNPTIWENEKIQHFEGVNHPYGAAMCLTENSVATSLFQRLITNITGNGLISFALLNYLYLLGLLLSTLILYKILCSFLQVPWLIFMLSVGLPWLHPQINELGLQVGLSFSWIILLVIYLLVLIRNNFSKTRKVVVLSACLVALAGNTVLFHYDFLAISQAIIGSFCFYWGLGNIRKGINTLKIWGLGAAIVVLSILIARVFLVSLGFEVNIIAQDIFNIKSLFVAYDFLNVPFFIQEEILAGTQSYLGSFALYGISLFLVLQFFIKRNQSKTSNERKRMMWLIFFVGLTSLVISFIGNTFWVESKARFTWPFYWGLNFLVAFFADRFYRSYKGKGLSGYLLVALLTLLFFDSADRMYFQMDRVAQNPFTNNEAMAPIQELTKGLDLSSYQAILPIPFYQNEKPQSQWGISTYQLSYATGLRLMSADLEDRIAGIDLETIFLENKLEVADENRFSAKPVLVFYSNDPEDYKETLGNRFYGKLKEMEGDELAATGAWKLYRLNVK